MVRQPLLDPRKRPRQARSAATVDAILEAAARILETRGPDGYTTNAVAELAGVSIGSLYQYFPNKEALVGALIQRETAVLMEDAAVALTAETGREALTGLIRAAVAHQLRRPVLARILDFEEGRRPEAHGVPDIRESGMAILAGLLVRPDLPPQPDPAVAAGDVMAMVRGMVDAAGERGENDRAALEERVSRAVFGYLRTPKVL